MYLERIDKIMMKMKDMFKRFDSKVLTTRGVTPICNLLPGDRLLSYYGDDFLEVKMLFNIFDDIFDVYYSDGRMQTLPGKALLFLGDWSIKDGPIIRTVKEVRENLEEYKKYSNKQHLIKNMKEHVDYLMRDPYMVGLFMIHGDLHDRYMNLERVYESQSINYGTINYLNEKLHIFPIENDDRKIYFRHEGSFNRIEWIEFFSMFPFVNNRNIKRPAIPTAYTRGTPNERFQLIRGVFDFSYKMENELATVRNISGDKLKEVQRILWSLGIASLIHHVSEDNVIESLRLEVYHKHIEELAGLFYDVKTIKDFISLDTHPFAVITDSDFHVSNIFPRGTGYMYQIITEKPYEIYLTEDFLPGVSYNM